MLVGLLILGFACGGKSDDSWKPDPVRSMAFSAGETLVTMTEAEELLKIVRNKDLARSTASDKMRIELVVMIRDETWIIARAILYAGNTVIGTDVNNVVIFSRSSGKWHVFAKGDKEFTRQVNLVPANLLGVELKARLIAPPEPRVP